MAENTVEILIRARDEASRTLNQAIGQMEVAQRTAAQGSQALVRSSDQVAAAAVISSRQIRAAGVSARFLGFTLLSEVTPALGTTASRLASLASVATLGGSAITALGTVAIGGLILALGSYIEQARKAKEEQEALNKVIREGTDAALASALATLRKQEIEQQERLAKLREAESKALLGRSLFAVEIEQQERRLGQIRENVLDVTRALNRATTEKLEGDSRVTKETEKMVLATLEAEAALKAYNQAVIDTTKSERERFAVLIAITQAETRERAQIELKGIEDREQAEERAQEKSLGQAEDALKKRADLAIAFGRLGLSEIESFGAAERLIQQRDQAEGLALLRESLEGQRELVLMHADLMARHGATAGEQFSGGITAGLMRAQDAMGTFGENVGAVLFGSAQAWSRGLDDAFFSVITGQTRKLQDVFKQMGAAILRNLTGVFARLATESLLRQLEGAFGLAPGRQQGFSPAPLAAMVPGGAAAGAAPSVGVPSFPFFNPFATAAPISAAGTTVPTAEILREGGAAAAGPGIAGVLGGSLALAGGLLAIASTAQMTSPALGAVIGGVGGLSAASGLSTLFGLGLGPIGLGIGFAFGAIGGFLLSQSARRRAERQIAFQRAVVDVFNRIEREAERFSPEQIDELLGFLERSEQPSDPAVVSLVNAILNLTGLQGTPPGGVLPPGLVPIGVPTPVLGVQRFRDLIGAEAFDSLLDTLRGLRTRAEAAGGFLIEEALAPGITRLEALATLGPRQRAQAIAALQRGALVSLINAAGPEELELILNRLREFAELIGLPILPQARFIEVLG